jgi:cyclic pyranopterin phosphate synthase
VAKSEKTPHPFSHLDETGAARMVDVSRKSATSREAIARGEILLGRPITEAVASQSVKKGDVLGVARIAGIMAAKRAPEAIPLCHPLALTGCDVHLDLDKESFKLIATCRVATTGATGVEMEALSGVSGALLAVYDMCKAIDKGMVIGPIRLLEKSGGKSGTWREGQGEADLESLMREPLGDFPPKALGGPPKKAGGAGKAQGRKLSSGKS